MTIDKEKAGNIVLSLLSFVVVLLDIDHEASTHTHGHEDLSMSKLRNDRAKQK